MLQPPVCISKVNHYERSCLPPLIGTSLWPDWYSVRMVCRWLGCHAYCLTAPRRSASLRLTAPGMALLPCSLIARLSAVQSAEVSADNQYVNELCCCPCGLALVCRLELHQRPPRASCAFTALSLLSYGRMMVDYIASMSFFTNSEAVM